MSGGARIGRWSSRWRRPGVQPIAHRDVLRQARVIRALAHDAGTRPGGALRRSGRPARTCHRCSRCRMSTGARSEPLFDGADCGPEAVVAERFRNAAAIMAQLHRIEPGAVGLASEPVIGPSAEVERWCRTLETVDAALVPGWREVAADLESSTPPSLPAAIVHGDFRLGNLLLSRPHHRRHRLGDLVRWRSARGRRLVLDQLRSA